MSVRVQRTSGSAETGTYVGDKSIQGNLIVKGPHPAIDIRSAPWSVDTTGTTSDVTGNTQAFNAALAAALLQGVGDRKGSKVIIGAGKIKINDTVYARRTGVQYGGISLLGDAFWPTEIAYEGPNDRAALYLDGQSGCRIGNFSITRNPASRGTSTGLYIGASVGSGTQSVGLDFLPIAVSGFAVGVQVGDSGAAAVSEVQFRYLKASSCDQGVRVDSFNTLNVVLQFLDTNLCGTGMYINTAGQVYVGAGAGAGNTIADFRQGTNAANEVRNWRTETVNRLLNIDAGYMILDNVIVSNYKGGHDGVAIDAEGGAGLTMRNCDLGVGQVVTNNLVLMVAENCKIGGPYYVNPPLAIPTRNMANTTVTAMACYLNNAGVFTDTGPKAVYVGVASGALKLIEQVTPSGNALTAYSSKAGDPTTAEVPAGTYSLWENTTTGVLKHWANRGGSLKSVALA